MKIYMNILFLGLLVLSSCSKSNGNVTDFKNDNQICTPYVSTSFTTTDFPIFETDESTTIVDHRQEGNCLILDTRFSGGCEEHVLLLLIDEGEDVLNLNGNLPARLSHNNTDACEAIVALEVFVDISNLEPAQAGVVFLIIENYDKIVELVF